jgi:hypothetical protein
VVAGFVELPDRNGRIVLCAAVSFSSVAYPQPGTSPSGTLFTGDFRTMTDSELYRQFCEYLDSIFPDGGGGPSWSQEPYRSDLFKLFAASHGSCHLHGDEIRQYLRDQWFPGKNLSEEDSDAVFDICGAWSEWQYAWNKRASMEAGPMRRS